MIVRRLSAPARIRYAHVDACDTERARIVVVARLTPGVAAMTLGRWILVRRGHEESVGLIAHELVHVEQWRTLGAVTFLRRYLGAYVRGRRAGLRHWAAYRAIPFEEEARLRSGA
ncbi:MAG: eCIS core domain-containing protein [Acidimicrobiia bacterium]